MLRKALQALHRPIAWMLRSRALAILVVALLAVPAFAQTGTAPTATAPTPEQVKSLVQLLSDPVVKSWLERQLQSGGVAEVATPSAAVPAVGMVEVEGLLGRHEEQRRILDLALGLGAVITGRFAETPSP